MVLRTFINGKGERITGVLVRDNAKTVVLKTGPHKFIKVKKERLV